MGAVFGMCLLFANPKCIVVIARHLFALFTTQSGYASDPLCASWDTKAVNDDDESGPIFNKLPHEC